MARYLLLDDDRASLMGLERLLTGDGHEVVPYTSARRALDGLTRGVFDVIVTDLELPDADGRAVIRAARELHPHACVVVVTATNAATDLLAAEGACVVADKPIEYEHVVRAVARCGAHRRGKHTNDRTVQAHLRRR